MAAKNNMDRQLEEAVESFLKGIGRTIATILKSLFRGIKKLNKWPPWVGLGITALVACGAIFCKAKILELEAPIYIRWLLYYALLCTPALYLLALGSSSGNSQQEYDKSFRDIGFVGKDGKPPCFCGTNGEEKKRILVFKSNIPLSEWKTAKARLETALDCNIVKMENGNSKKVVKLTTLPADFKLPEKILWKDSYFNPQDGIITIGQGAPGNISFNLNRVPHVLVAGETGSGKSVILHCILFQMILQGCKVFMIDFKGGVEFNKRYEHYGEVITDRSRALEVLELLVRENECRLQLFRELEVKNLSEYNRKTKQNLCRIGVFSDELAEMLDKKGVAKEDKKTYEALEGRLSTLARLSRATGINLFLGVQRPDANVLTGQIKNNIPVRISGRFADKTASEIVLGNTDAVELPDIKGRFLYKVGNETIEFQSYLFDDETMLHDVNVEVGNMLTEASYYDRYAEEIEKQWRERTVEPAKKAKGRFAKKKVKEKAGREETSKADAYKMGEELVVPFGESIEVDDLDLNF